MIPTVKPQEWVGVTLDPSRHALRAQSLQELRAQSLQEQRTWTRLNYLFYQDHFSVKSYIVGGACLDYRGNGWHWSSHC